MLPALVLGALALAFLLFVLLRGREGKTHDASLRENRTREGAGAPSAGPRPGTCTLCGSVLHPGERMKSDMFPGSSPRMMRIFGCTHCLGAQGASIPRFCPVCSGELGFDDYAIARYFERPGRKHVHVLGCTRCREKMKETVHGR